MRHVKLFVGSHLGTIQGIGGAACVAAGSFVLWGIGWALIALGAFFLLGAWGSQ